MKKLALMLAVLMALGSTSVFAWAVKPKIMASPAQMICALESRIATNESYCAGNVECLKGYEPAFVKLRAAIADLKKLDASKLYDCYSRPLTPCPGPVFSNKCA